MEPFPHIYAATAAAARTGGVTVGAAGLPQLLSAPAAQFGGPGTLWSPEALLAAAVADCFILTFRAVSAAALFGWVRLECRAEGTLSRNDRQVRFTAFNVHATLTLAPGADRAKARRLLRRTERSCLILNSLNSNNALEMRVLHESTTEHSTTQGAV